METPRYEVIRADLETQILSGQLSTGEKVPTEAQLQQQYAVSRSVAQRALNDLAQAGLVARHQGRGTHVTSGPQELNLLRSIDPSLGDAGAPGYLTVVSAKVMEAATAGVSIPELGDHDPVNHIVRVRYKSKGSPLGVEISVTPFKLTPTLLNNDLAAVSIRAYLADQGIVLTRSRMYLEPTSLENPYAELLNVPQGTPILRRRRHMWQANGDTAELATYYIQPNEISFYVEYPETYMTNQH